jgi:fumarate hydratase class I
MELRDAILELIRRAATDLSADVEQVLIDAERQEAPGSAEKNVMATILENVHLAREASTPICQDTGTMTFFVDSPPRTDNAPLETAIMEATRLATEKQYLRPNAVDPLTGKNTKTNIGTHHPVIHFHQWPHIDKTRIRLLLKGGGSENVGAQYKLPTPALKAGRDLEGVYKVVVDAVNQAQGLGCAPGILGVGIGGDRASSYELAKQQFFRRIGQRHENPVLAELETRLLKDLNTLGIGPMGFGGKSTILEVFCDAQARHPASFFVAITYSCWAFRRKTLIIDKGEVTHD